MKTQPELRGLLNIYVFTLECTKQLCADTLLQLLKTCPDLERLIARVHVGTCKLPLFLDLLDAFDKVHRFSSVALTRIVSDFLGGKRVQVAFAAD